MYKLSELTYHPVANAKSDFLGNRIRKFVQLLVAEEEKKKDDILRFDIISDRKRNIPFRIFWIAVLVMNFGLFLYQSYDRIEYFLTEPVAIIMNSESDKVTLEILPDITVCSLLTSQAMREGDTVCPWLFKQNTLNNNYDALQLWDIFNITSDLEFSFKKKFINHDLKLLHTMTPYGECVTFRIGMASMRFLENFEIRMKTYPKCDTLPIILYLHEEGLLAGQDYYPLVGGRLWEISFEKITVIHRLNRGRNPCLSKVAYIECIDKCIHNKFKTVNATCRYPFMPSSLNLPYCKNTFVNYSIYRKIFMAIIEELTEDKCGCPTRCTESLFTVLNHEIQSVNGWTAIHLDIKKNVEIFTEISLYTEVSLLCDIGGLLGLYFGWSILSLVLIITDIQDTLRNKPKKTSTIQTRDLIKEKTVKLFQLAMGNKKTIHDKKQILQNALMEKYKNQRGKVFYMFLLIMLFIGLVADRFYLLILNTTAVSVDIILNNTVEYANLHICEETDKIIYLKNILAYSGQPAEALIDLMDIKQGDEFLSPEEIWDFAKELNLSTDDSFTYSEKHLATRNGYCTIVNPDTREYSPGFSLVFYVNRKYVKLYEDDTYLVQISPHGDNSSVTEILVDDFSTQIFYSLKQFHQLNTRSKSCVERDEYEKCIGNCKKKASSSVLCKLPYMIDDSNRVPTCASYWDAFDSAALYLRVLDECHCTIKCDQDILMVIVENPTDYNEHTKRMINLYTSSNKIVHITESRSYPLIKFIADLGNLLAITLDICVMRIFLYMIGL